jgi:hypothetical protein
VRLAMADLALAFATVFFFILSLLFVHGLDRS